jgi:SAM-dependent methyltransferase
MNIARNEAGADWATLAGLDPLAAVLDPADTAGAKNRAIDKAHKHALQRACGNVEGLTVLDFGCGTGRLSAWLCARGAHVEGVDATEEMLAVARKQVPEARFQRVDGETLPFEASAFDLAVTAYVLQYYVLDSPTVAREIVRVLRPGGLFIAIEQVTGDPEGLGRGGRMADYASMLSNAGLNIVSTAIIRAGPSRIRDQVHKHPELGKLPGLMNLLSIEGRLAARTSIAAGGYVDAIFVARR